MSDGLFHVLDGDQADAAILIVDHQQLFDAMLVQHPLGLVLADILPHRDEVFVRHQLRNLLPRIGGKAHVAVGEDADELAWRGLAAPGHHGNARYAVRLHQRQRIRERRVGSDGQRIDHHAGFEFLHLPHLGGLALGVEITMDHADAAGLRHGNRHARLGDGVHCGRDDGDVERDRAGDAGADIDFGGEHLRQAGLQQHIVERERFANAVKSLRHRQLLSLRPSGRDLLIWG